MSYQAMEQTPATPAGDESPTNVASPAQDGSPPINESPGYDDVPTEDSPSVINSPVAFQGMSNDVPLPTLMTSRRPQQSADAIKPEPKADIKPEPVVEPAQPQPEAIGRENFYIGGDCCENFEIGDDDSPGSGGSEAAAGEMKTVKWAKLVSYASLIASGIVACLGLGIGVHNNTLSLVGLGLEAALDGLSSGLVIWRFKAGKPRQHENAAEAARFKAKRDAHRERHSGLGIGSTFIASAMLLLFSAAYKVVSWDAGEPVHAEEVVTGANWTVLLSMPSALAFGTLAVAKFRLATKLRSQVLEKDALCSLLGAVLALIVSVAGVLEEAAADAQAMAVVDSVASAIIALILLFEGSRTLKHNAKPPAMDIDDVVAAV